MFTIIGIMFGGIALGYLLRRIEWLQKTGKLISVAIVLLLFLLGLSVGQNPEIINNLGSLGIQAFILATAGTLGSVMAARAVYVWFFKDKHADEK